MWSLRNKNDFKQIWYLVKLPHSNAAHSRLQYLQFWIHLFDWLPSGIKPCELKLKCKQNILPHIDFIKSLLLFGPMLRKWINLHHFVFTINLVRKVTAKHLFYYYYIIFFKLARRSIFIFYFIFYFFDWTCTFPWKQSRLNIKYGLVGLSSHHWLN